MGLRDARLEEFAVQVGTGAEKDPLVAWCKAQGCAKGPRAEKAMREALGDPSVTSRIRQAQEAVLAETVASEVWLLDKLAKAIQGAYDEKKWQTVVQGVRLAGQHKTLQLFPTRVDHHRPDDPLEGMTREELVEEAVRLRLLEPSREVPRPALPNGEGREAEVVDAEVVQ